ncbi:CUE domain containing protein [Histomonas meleagridis]|uniref:CUE domain containing protein n=1 Tax=Histomonas meleagridis TaxID=135588 RepID=UPI00355A9E42|nr:CUE domain containing protein [Histomonas meleagridis]KAH0805468.1 CUE domain containing protein [Histomonas meleagridis]
MSSSALRSLQEMFPNHSPETIRRVLRECRGVVESAVNKLLRIPAPQPSVPTQKSTTNTKPHRSQDHIFPDDFLRWPKGIKWEKVQANLDNFTPLQTEADLVPLGTDPSISSDLPESEDIPILNPQQSQSGWDKLKDKFLSMHSQYTQL